MTTPYRADQIGSLLRPAEVLLARGAYEQGRIEEASEYVPLENLALSPRCGFASVAEGNRLSPDDQWRKLELLVDTARRVWD
jgi:methionine synthase II (cobalamin-independent)